MTEIKLHGYYPGVVGKITEIHAVFYNENWGFDVSFETQVGSELSELSANLIAAATDCGWPLKMAYLPDRLPSTDRPLYR